MRLRRRWKISWHFAADDHTARLPDATPTPRCAPSQKSRQQTTSPLSDSQRVKADGRQREEEKRRKSRAAKRSPRSKRRLFTHRVAAKTAGKPTPRQAGRVPRGEGPLEQAVQLIGHLGGCLRRSEVPDIVKQAQAGVGTISTGAIQGVLVWAIRVGF